MTLKLAISTDLALAALRGRMQQGARVAPGLVERLAPVTQAGATRAPQGLSALARQAGQDVRAQQGANLFAAHPIPAARRAASTEVMRLEEAAPQRMFDLARGEGKMLEVPFASQEKKDMLFGAGATLHDPLNVGAALPVSGPAAAKTVAGARRPSRPSPYADTVMSSRPKIAAAVRPVGQINHIPGNTRNLDVDPRAQISAAFDQQELLTQRQDPLTTVSAPKYAAARKLRARIKFRDLPISIETGKGEYRHWYDPHTGKSGKTKMLYPYGYIRRTKGLDGDHVDVFVGPNEKAANVYVFMINKAPDFKRRDEQKCFLGFDSEEAARKVFDASYNDPRFFHSMTTLSYEKFRDKVLATFDNGAKKLASSYVDDLQPLGVEEKSIGLPPVGAQRHILGEPLSPSDRVSRLFDSNDLETSTTAIEDSGGATAL